MVRVTVEPLYVGGRGSGGFHAAILRLGRFSLLMNCGATDLLDPHDIDLLLPNLNEIDSIFISHGSLRHLGGLPLLHARQKAVSLSESSSLDSPFHLCCCFSAACRECSVPAFLTQASQRLGKVALEDAVLSNAQSRGVHACAPARSVHTPPEPGEAAAPGTPGEKARGEGRRGEAGVKKEGSEGSEGSVGVEEGSAEAAVSVKDISVIMEACRVLRYEERVRLFPRRRRDEQRDDKMGEGEEKEKAEAREEARDFRRDRAHSDADDESDQEEDDTEVYVHCIQAGHALGGAVWLFDADGRKVVFAVDHSLNPLWHVDGSALLSLLPSLNAAPSTPSPSPSFSSPSRDSFSAPCLFISDVHEPPTGLHSWRVPALRGFFLQIAHVLQRGGDVIIPLDIGSPLLELLLHLEALWRLAPSLHGFPIFLLSPVSASFLLACRPLLPQSTQRARALFASQRVNPLFTGSSASLSSLLSHRLAAPPLPEATRDSPWLARKQTRRASLKTLLPFSPGSNLLGGRLPETGNFVASAVGADGLPARVWGKDGDGGGNVAGGPGPVALPAPDWSPTSGVSAPPPGSPPAAGEAGAQRPSGTEGARRTEEVQAEAVFADWAGGRAAGFMGPPGLANPAGVFGGARTPQGTAGTGSWSASCGLPFGNLKFVKLLSTEREIEHLLQQREQEREKNNAEPRRPGCVFVCTPASLDSGFGRCLLIREAEEEANAIFFLSEPWPGTTAHRVWSAQKARVASACSTQTPRREDSSFCKNDGEETYSPELVLTQTRRVALSPEELLRLFEREKEQRALELEKKRHPGEANEAREEPGEPAKEEQMEETGEEKGPLLLHEGDDRDLVDYDDDIVENLEDIDAAPSLFPFAGFALPQDDPFYAQTEEIGGGDAQDEGEEPAVETAAETCGADEGPALGASSRGPTNGVESDGDNPWLDTRGPCMQGDRDDFAQPTLGFACASLGREAAGDRGSLSGRQVKEASEASRRVVGFEGDAKKEKEEEEDFGVAVSAEQKAVWTAATLSVGTAAASGAPVPGDSKLLWAGGGVWPGSDRVAVASAFALPHAGLFAGGAEAYRHLVEGEKRIAGAPRRRQEKLKAELLLAKRGGHVAAASPWLGVPSSLAFSAFGVASSPCPAGLVGAPPGLLPGMRPTAGDAHRLQETALPAWRRQLRQWVGGEDPTGVESLTVKVSLRCHVECVSGGLEGVTSLQGLVNFLSLLRPQNVFLLPSSTGPLTRGLVRSLCQTEELQTRRLVSIRGSEGENGDTQSSHLDETPAQNSEETEMTDAEPRPHEASPLHTSELLSSKSFPSLTECRPDSGPVGGETVSVRAKEALQVGLGHRLVASLLASLGPHTRVQLLVPRASWAPPSPSVSLDTPRFSHVGLLDLPSGQAVLRLDRRLWAELQAHAVPVPAPRAARGALETRQTPGPDQERPNWGQRLCFVARARGAVQLLGSEERVGEGEETGPAAETAVEARTEPGRKRLRSGSDPKARRRRFGRTGPSGSACQSGSFWCPSLRPSFRLVSCDDPTLEETGQTRESASQREETHGAHESASGGMTSCPGASAASASREHVTFSEDKGHDDKRATLLLGRLQLGDVARHLWGHLGREGGGRGDEADSRDAEREEREAKSEIAFAPQGQVLSLADCAAIRIVQDGHGSRASVWEVESSVHPWFFYLRRLFASQPFALTGS